MIRDKTKAFILRTGVVYGFGASAYLLAWNLYDLIHDKPFPYGFLQHEYSFLGLLVLHGVMLVLCFQERSLGEFRWGSLLTVAPGSVRAAKSVLVVALLYFVVLFLALIIKPRFAGEIPRDQSHWEIVFTSLILVQTLYVGLFFLVGREKLLSKEARILLDWPALLGQLLRKFGR